jgi:hypothetical protein
MKALAILLAVTTIGLGAVSLVQWRKLNEQQSQMTALRAEKDEQLTQIQDLETKQVRAEQQQHELARHADNVASQLIARTVAESNALARAASTNSASAASGDKSDDKDAGGLGNMLSKMMKDPAMKKMIQGQQRQMMNQLYSPLITQMGLTKEEADKFKDLLSENTMKATEKASSLFGDQAATNRTELASAMADQQKDFDAQVKDLLGDARYAQYKDYQETVGERTQLNVFKQQNAGSENALSDQQTEQLLSFMKEEKKSLAASGQPVMGNGQDAASMQAMFDSDQTEKMLASQEDINQRVYDRAKTVLSPSQLDSFGQYQTNQIQMMRMGMSMARKMFSPGKSSDPPPAPQPTAQP